MKPRPLSVIRAERFEASLENNLERLLSEGEEQAALEAFIANWARQYGNALQLQPRNRKLFLQFDRQVAAPEDTLARSIEALDLPETRAEASDLPAGKHTIGSNDDVFATNGRSRRRRTADAERPAPTGAVDAL